ncbi:hypothetical protein [Mesorhizobium neociceri]|uniref:Uncharacterized protein n=1 Tax=Mesorhizobium neociceri TaxID=1307853 RepID=A0A838B6C4_9HYPH|nr:hypothetical protein [Mesorhizobium neociceri]MBA1140970.1 hypothetical protein [Mesorhizobium neociceri]
MHQHILDPSDSFPIGYRLPDAWRVEKSELKAMALGILEITPDRAMAWLNKRPAKPRSPQLAASAVFSHRPVQLTDSRLLLIRVLP